MVNEELLALLVCPMGKAPLRREGDTLICTRCGTMRTRVMTLAGELLRNSYSYPNGYLMKHQGRLTPADRAMIRSINLKSALEESS